MIAPALRSALFLAFFLSGCSGLIFQTVWVRMLTRYVGATSYATATVLAVFMGGLAIGGWLGGRFADRARRPALIYAVLELLIAATGLAASFVVIQGLSTYYVSFYDTFGTHPSAVLLLRIVFIVCCLLPPTVLMGATLPLLVSFVSRLGDSLQVGLAKLYTINTLGAVVGVLVAGLFLIGEFGERTSLIVAGSLNLLAALLAVALRSPQGAAAAPITAATSSEDAEVYSPGVRRLAVLAFMISGYSALAYEIFWSRYLVLWLQTSIYAFSVMLGTFLVGITMGSLVVARQKRHADPLAKFGMLEILIGFWTVLGLGLLPWSNDLFIAASSTSHPVAYRFILSAMTCVAWVMPIAFFFGVQFPIAIRCCQRRSDAPGRTTGMAYAANTLGTIIGALSASFLLIPLLGTARAMVLVAALNIVIGLFLLAAAPAIERKGRLVLGFGLAVVFVGLAYFVGDPYRPIMAARFKSIGSGWEIFHSFESATANTISGGDLSKKYERTLVVNGTGMTELCNETKLMAYLPYLLAENPKRLLVVCFGMGTTFRSASQYPDLVIDAVDIVPEVFQCFSDFHPDAEVWTSRPNAHLHADDGRHFLLIHPEKYDVITIDPAPPLYSAGTVNLYTKEFFQLCKDRLAPKGVLNVWLPEAPEIEMKLVMRSFLEVFPEMSLWGSLGYPGFFLIGGHQSMHQTPEQVAAIAKKLSTIPDLLEWKINADYSQPAEVERLYMLDGPGLRPYLEGVPVVSDDHPYTEFPLWRRLFHADREQSFSPEKFRQRIRDGGGK
jgi:spermidine synthase